MGVCLKRFKARPLISKNGVFLYLMDIITLKKISTLWIEIDFTGQSVYLIACSI
jgi:hypothetical protein